MSDFRNLLSEQRSDLLPRKAGGEVKKVPPRWGFETGVRVCPRVCTLGYYLPPPIWGEDRTPSGRGLAAVSVTEFSRIS